MRLSSIMKESNIVLSAVGMSAMAKAIKMVFPNLNANNVDDSFIVYSFIDYDLSEEDCLSIITLTGKYAKLWIFT